VRVTLLHTTHASADAEEKKTWEMSGRAIPRPTLPRADIHSLKEKQIVSWENEIRHEVKNIDRISPRIKFKKKKKC
jgi:hypothetical protein